MGDIACDPLATCVHRARSRVQHLRKCSKRSSQAYRCNGGVVVQTQQALRIPLSRPETRSTFDSSKRQRLGVIEHVAGQGWFRQSRLKAKHRSARFGIAVKAPGNHRLVERQIRSRYPDHQHSSHGRDRARRRCWRDGSWAWPYKNYRSADAGLRAVIEFFFELCTGSRCRRREQVHRRRVGPPWNRRCLLLESLCEFPWPRHQPSIVGQSRCRSAP